MALILNIETGGSTCSVCLSVNGQLILEKKEILPNRHAAILTVLIQQLCAETNTTLHQLDAVAISGGPGSYTGLRIGTAVAKGLCYTLHKPLLAVSSLQSLAWKMKQQNASLLNNTFIPLLQARKDAVYYAVYDNELNASCPERVASLSEVTEHIKNLKNQSTAGFFNLNDAIVEHFKTFGILIDYFECVSSNGCELAFSKFQQGSFEDCFLYEPFYMTGFGKNF